MECEASGVNGSDSENLWGLRFRGLDSHESQREREREREKEREGESERQRGPSIYPLVDPTCLLLGTIRIYRPLFEGTKRVLVGVLLFRIDVWFRLKGFLQVEV